jgi:hypothetical protein
MFNMPTPVDPPFANEPIFIDEAADAIGLVMGILVANRQERWQKSGRWDLIDRAGAAHRICDNFDIDEARTEVEDMMDSYAFEGPYEAFVLASQENNLVLGRRAISHIDLRDGKRDMWQGISGAKSNWQLALVKLVMPDPSYLVQVHSGQPQPSPPPLDMKKVAKKFQPE